MGSFKHDVTVTMKSTDTVLELYTAIDKEIEKINPGFDYGRLFYTHDSKSVQLIDQHQRLCDVTPAFKNGRNLIWYSSLVPRQFIDSKATEEPCIVCHADKRPARSTLWRCGHGMDTKICYICATCGPKLVKKQCPMCRADVSYVAVLSGNLSEKPTLYNAQVNSNPVSTHGVVPAFSVESTPICIVL